MVVDAVIAIGNDDRLNMIGIKKVQSLDEMVKNFFSAFLFCID